MRGRPASWPSQKLRAAMSRGYFRTADLFAGCGGMSLGFHRAQYRCVAAVEENSNARASHEKNFARCVPEGTYATYGDITKTPSVQAVKHLAKTREASKDAVDVIIGGPPCQAFSRLGRAALWSIAGRRHSHVDDPRATLYEHYLSYVEDLRPLAFVLENVPEIASFNGTNVAEEIAAAAEDLGYQTRYSLLNAAWYGVPQFRDRVFIVGVRRELGFIPTFPARTHRVEIPTGYISSRAGRLNGDEGSYILAPHPHFVDHTVDIERRHSVVPIQEAFRDLPLIVEHLRKKKVERNIDAILPYRAPASGFSAEMRNWPGFSSNGGSANHVIRLTPRDYPIFRNMDPGDNYVRAVEVAEQLFAKKLADRRRRGIQVPEDGDLWKELRKATVPPYPTNKFPDKFQKLDACLPSATVPAHLGKDTYSHIHPDDEQARAISIREAARLQSFPDAFEFAGGIGARYTQIGNAVPPLLAYAIAANLRRELEEASRKSLNS